MYKHLSALKSLSNFSSFVVNLQVLVFFLTCRNMSTIYCLLLLAYVFNVPVNSKTAHAPPPPWAFDFFEKFWSNSPLCCQFRRSNAPPVRASKRVKSSTLEACKSKLWKQVLQSFQPLQISCSACLRSTL